MFQIGDMVVHPGYGVGKVVDIEKLACLGSDKRYYSIRLVADAGTQVWVPVQEAEGRGNEPEPPRCRPMQVDQGEADEAYGPPEDGDGCRPLGGLGLSLHGGLDVVQVLLELVYLGHWAVPFNRVL